MRAILLLFFLFISPLLADEALVDLGTHEGPTYNYWGQFANMLLTLAFVLILIFVSIWVLKKIMRSRMQTLNRSNGIQVIERRPLNPKASLYLVDILGKGVVIAESQGGISLIKEFSDEVKIKELLEQFQQEQKPRANFGELFAKFKKRSLSKVDNKVE